MEIMTTMEQEIKTFNANNQIEKAKKSQRFLNKIKKLHKITSEIMGVEAAEEFILGVVLGKDDISFSKNHLIRKSGYDYVIKCNLDGTETTLKARNNGFRVENK